MSILVSFLRALAVVSILAALAIYMEFWDISHMIKAAEGRSVGIMQGLVIGSVFLFIGAAYIEEKILKRTK